MLILHRLQQPCAKLCLVSLTSNRNTVLTHQADTQAAMCQHNQLPTAQTLCMYARRNQGLTPPQHSILRNGRTFNLTPTPTTPTSGLERGKHAPGPLRQCSKRRCWSPCCCRRGLQLCRQCWLLYCLRHSSHCLAHCIHPACIRA